MEKTILFEPWGLGDAIVALATAIQEPDRFLLACNPRWHPILRAAARDVQLPQLISVEVSYGSRNKSGNDCVISDEVRLQSQGKQILSIRGDVRDYLSARRLFRGSNIRMNGWMGFFAKRSAIFDWPYARGWKPIRNRYRAWADLANINWTRIEEFYCDKEPRPSRKRVGIHVGAQWRSKQYPHAAELARQLRQLCDVTIMAAPSDILPDGVEEKDVTRLANEELVRGLCNCSHVIANDSGPMHLAAFLRRRTIAVGLHTSLAQWLPPTAVAIESALTPKGYRLSSAAAYLSDNVSTGWPAVSEVIRHVNEM